MTTHALADERARSTAEHIALTETFTAHNYHPLPVVPPTVRARG